LAEFTIDLVMELVCRADGVRVDVDRSGFALLRCLLAHATGVVDKETLLAEGWPGRVVSENSLAKAISRLRRALGDIDGQLIVAVHGYGYRLGVPPEVVLAEPRDLPLSAAPKPRPGHASLTPPPSASRRRFPELAMRRWRLALTLAAVTALMAVSLLMAGALTVPSAKVPTTGGSADLPRIAFVPLRDLSRNGSLPLLSRGIAEHLRRNAHRLPGLLVSDPGPAAEFREDGENAARIGSALGVDLVVGGDVDSIDGRLRVELRIDDLRDQLPAMRRHFQRDASEQATLLDDLTFAMFEVLGPHGTRSGTPANRAGGTTLPEAHYAFLRASTILISNNDPSSHRRTVAVLEQAIELDENYADAVLMLGGVLGGSGYYADTPTELRAGRRRALAMMDRGIALTPTDPLNYLLRSEMRLLYAFDWTGALADIEAARALASAGPSEAMLKIWQARFLASMNEIDAAIAMGSQAIALSPDSGGRRNQGWHYLALGDTRSARAVLRLQLPNYPESPHVHFYLALCDILEGQPEAALRQLEHSSPLFRLTGTAVAQYELGNQEASDIALTALENRYTPADGYWVAAVHAWRGEADAAFTWLDYAERAGDSSLMYLPFDPHWRSLRADPRMHSWVQRLAPPPSVRAASLRWFAAESP
jgi:DNA-binding winged helix-turn-helix (wHTH) protein/TolB-like protein/Tfp pilus assembly protein PilF